MCICYYRDLKLAEAWSENRKFWNLVDPESQSDKKLRTDRTYPGMENVIVVPADREGFPGNLVIAQWGLTPFWAPKPSWGRSNGYNARSETLLEKSTWRKPFQERRCIVPVRAFYERDNGRWLRFARTDGDPMPVAGLYEEPNKHCEIPTFALVTTDPNELVSQIHDRMPVVLSETDMSRWLDPGADLDELRAMLCPIDSNGMEIGDAGPIRKPGELKGEAEAL
jgi:putative SOS response-associated peptidase YedK